MEIVDSKGSQVVVYRYDAWGGLLVSSDASGFGLSQINPLRYRGYYYDQETGLYYLKERYYNPEWRRFVNSDSVLGIVSKLKSHNCYEYCHSSPMVYGDTLSVIIGIMNLLYSFVVDPIVGMIPTTIKEPLLVYRKFGKRKQSSEPF